MSKIPWLEPILRECVNYLDDFSWNDPRRDGGWNATSTTLSYKYVDLPCCWAAWLSWGAPCGSPQPSRSRPWRGRRRPRCRSRAPPAAGLPSASPAARTACATPGRWGSSGVAQNHGAPPARLRPAPPGSAPAGRRSLRGAGRRRGLTPSSGGAGPWGAPPPAPRGLRGRPLRHCGVVADGRVPVTWGVGRVTGVQGGLLVCRDYWGGGVFIRGRRHQWGI